MTWFKKQKSPLAASKEEDKTIRTEGLFTKCEGCRAIIWKKDLDANERVCPKCNYHFKIGARDRLRMLFDDGNYEVQDQNLVSTDPLKFVDRQPYAQKLAAARAATKLNDAVINARGKLGGPADPDLSDGVRFHRRLHGIGGGRDADAGHGAGRAREDSRSSSCPHRAARACTRALFR